MPDTSKKSATDVFWNDRALSEQNTNQVNIADLAQRSLENEFIFASVKPTDSVLEVGCGNGQLTKDLRTRVAHVDSFDFSENMISAARTLRGEKNNRFFSASILDTDAAKTGYDVVLSVRVLINLANIGEQKQAIANMAGWLKPGGRIILVEGFLDGFIELNHLRMVCGLPEMKPAAINFYSKFDDLSPCWRGQFDVIDEWHSGCFDLLTRITYPLLSGANKAVEYSGFHEKILPMARALKIGEFAKYARLRGMVLRQSQ